MWIKFLHFTFFFLPLLYFDEGPTQIGRHRAMALYETNLYSNCIAKLVYGVGSAHNTLLRASCKP